MKQRALSLATTAVAVVLSAAASAQTVVKIGILNDRSSVYSDAGGVGSEVGARLAAEDFMAANPKVKVEFVAADHQNKPDIAAGIARRWFDTEGVDIIIDVPNTAAALAVGQIAQDKDKLFIDVGAASSDLTGQKCLPNMMHWAFDTWSMANGIVNTLVKQGNDSWFFITADYTFGHALERDASGFVKSSGGTVVGSVRHPFPANDFSSFIVQAQGSKAKVIGLANSGGDTVNLMKQASEFGMKDSGQKLAPLILTVPDIDAIGLDVAEGSVTVEGYYWDRDDVSRAFSKRFAERFKNRVPNMVQAGNYSAVMHYLKSVAAAGSKDTKTVIAAMKATPTEDIVFGKGRVRSDGRHIHDMHVFQVKKPSESKSKWDMYRYLSTIPAEQAFRPVSDGGCPTAKGS